MLTHLIIPPTKALNYHFNTSFDYQPTTFEMNIGPFYLAPEDGHVMIVVRFHVLSQWFIIWLQAKINSLHEMFQLVQAVSLLVNKQLNSCRDHHQETETKLQQWFDVWELIWVYSLPQIFQIVKNIGTGIGWTFLCISSFSIVFASPLQIFPVEQRLLCWRWYGILLIFLPVLLLYSSLGSDIFSFPFVVFVLLCASLHVLLIKQTLIRLCI